MLVDCFLGNDEVDLAEFRIRYLENSVDLFVIGESDQTFTGKSKEQHFAKHFRDGN